jgi:hypothetical protein
MGVLIPQRARSCNERAEVKTLHIESCQHDRNNESRAMYLKGLGHVVNGGEAAERKERNGQAGGQNTATNQSKECWTTNYGSTDNMEPRT